MLVTVEVLGYKKQKRGSGKNRVYRSLKQGSNNIDEQKKKKNGPSNNIAIGTYSLNTRNIVI